MVLGRRGERPLFPPVLGTGFLVDPRGLVLTNRHVVQGFAKIPKNPDTGKSAAAAVVFLEVQTKNGWNEMGAIIADVRASWTPVGFFHKSAWYGEDDPDLAFVQLNVIDTPALSISAEPNVLEVGLGIATAGFPLGDLVITMFGKITQVSPMLRRGIVSSVFPFPGALPHGFTTDIMIQGGASGSPVFLEDQPTVIGMLGATLLDDGANTNISIALPGHLLGSALEKFLAGAELDTTGVPTLQSLVETHHDFAPLSWQEFVTPCPGEG